MSRAIDPAKSALLRYLADCIRAEQRAQALLQERQARTEQAKRQIIEYQRQQVPTADEMLARARLAARRNTTRRRS